MGFGILFTGWFLLLNVFYSAYTDLLSALITLAALTRLGRYDRHFRMALVWAVVFAVYGAAELALTLVAALAPLSAIGKLLSAGAPLWLTLPRYAILGSMSVFTLLGVRAIGEEVDAIDVYGRTGYLIPLNAGVFALCALLEIPAVGALFGGLAAPVFVVAVLAMTAVTALDLALIYRAYRRICLPGELTEPKRAAGKEEKR